MKPGSIRLDVASAYVVTAARVGAWALVSALVYRRLGAAAFAVLALVRATAGVLAYTSLGLAPAMVRFLAEADKPAPATPTPTPTRGDNSAAAPAQVAPVLHYLGADADATPTPAQRVFASAGLLSLGLGLAGLVAAAVYAGAVGVVHRGIPYQFKTDASLLALFFGAGIVLRMMSEVAAGLLQVRGRMALDNLLQAAAEIAWLGFSAAWLWARGPNALGGVGVAFSLASLLLLLGRVFAARTGSATRDVVSARRPDFAVMRRLLAFGFAVTLAQAADFLYVPTDYLLIDWLISTKAVAVYAPALQIDAALLLVVAAVANVLLPRVAVGHAAGDVGRVRAYYVRGTLASLAALACAALAVWLASPLLLRLWLGSDLPETRALLPWVLVHTVVGGSGAVGRSVLLGMGKVTPFTTAVILAGVANVLLSYTFVRFFGMGLYGIVLGTIVVVVARSAIWTPWYVLRTLGFKDGPGRMKEAG